MDPSTTSNNFFFIRFGKNTTPLIPFNDQTSLNDVEFNVHTWFNLVLPEVYHIGFYSSKAKTFLNFDQKVLTSEYNPFLVDTSENGEIIESVTDYVELFIVDDSGINPSVNLPASVPCNNTSVEYDTAASTDQMNQIQSNQDVSENNIARTNSEEENDNHLLEEIPEPVLNHPSSSFMQTSNENVRAIIPSDHQNTSLSRLSFSHDVQKHQKDNYLSNIFPVAQQSVEEYFDNKPTKGISYIQGTKSQEQKMRQVLSTLQCPDELLNEDDTDLLIYGVHEKVQNGIRFWHIHRDKGFLLKNELKPGAQPHNPIAFSKNEIILTKDGNFELKIYMLTKWEKSGAELEIHRLDEATTIQLHPEPHRIQASGAHIAPVRLLCVLKRAGTIDWTTACLSDFIEPPKSPPKRNVSIDTSEKTDVTPKLKRMKTK